MGQFKTSLKPDDLKLFYDVLYQYENSKCQICVKVKRKEL